MHFALDALIVVIVARSRIPGGLGSRDGAPVARVREIPAALRSMRAKKIILRAQQNCAVLANSCRINDLV
jgi:hypothetical protein